MSATEPAELRAYHELEVLVRHLGEELAVFRRRALAAEAQLKDNGNDSGRLSAGTASPGNPAMDLEAENRALRSRVQHAQERVRQLMDRVRFLRQQVELQTSMPAGRS